MHNEQDKSEYVVHGPVWKLPTGQVEAHALQTTGDEPPDVKPVLHAHVLDNGSQDADGSAHVQTSLVDGFDDPTPQNAHV